MGEFLFQYQPISPTTWAYLSSLVIIGLYFKFNRFWSLRNVDLLLLIAFAPGLLLLYFGYQSQPALQRAEVSAEVGEAPTSTAEQANSPEDMVASTTDAEQAAHNRSAFIKRFGYWWMLGCVALWLVRMMLDSMLVRRPMLNPNVTVGGLAFMGVSLFVFLMANVVSSPPVGEYEGSFSGPVRMDHLIELRQRQGPGYAILNELPTSATKSLVIVAHFMIGLGLILIGHRHFNNTANGFGAAMLYLLLPYTAQMTGRLDHFLPAAMLVWAVLCYRRPLFSGIFLGVACASIYYPLFLIPLWISFYWKRGSIRFLIGLTVALVVMSLTLLFTPSTQGFWSDLRRMFGILSPSMHGLEGIWDTRIGGLDPYYRIPLLAIVAVVALGLVLWPARKNLATLISGSAAVLLACQFWIGWGGGLYLAWFIPLVLLIVFRPNLENRVAQEVIRSPRFGKRKSSHMLAA